MTGARGLDVRKLETGLHAQASSVHRCDSKLEELAEWRNAIAHQDFGPGRLTPASLTLPAIRRWRRACNGLAVSFDRVMARYIASIAGSTPW